jgi:hypothetical protein
MTGGQNFLPGAQMPKHVGVGQDSRQSRRQQPEKTQPDQQRQRDIRPRFDGERRGWGDLVNHASFRVNREHA